MTSKKINMRLRVLKQILDENIPLLKLNAEGTTRNTGTVYQLKNSKEIQKAILEIDKLKLFENTIKKIKGYPLFTHSEYSIYFSDSEYKGLKNEIENINTECVNLSNALLHLIKKDEPNLISIKIPNPKSFADLEKTVSKLNKIFCQVLIANEIDGNLEIANFDNGSYWIDILVTGATAVNVIGGLAWSGAVVYKKLQEGRLLQAQVKEMSLTNEALEEILKKSKDPANKVAEIEAEFLYKTFFKGKDNEQIGRIKLALTELAELFSEGGEIHPALNVAPEIKKEFPDFNKLEKIETKIHKLEAKKK